MQFNVIVQRLKFLIGRLRQCCETFPDKRRGMNTTYSIADIGMAAFSVFFMQSPSFLSSVAAGPHGVGGQDYDLIPSWRRKRSHPGELCK